MFPIFFPYGKPWELGQHLNADKTKKQNCLINDAKFESKHNLDVSWQSYLAEYVQIAPPNIFFKKRKNACATSKPPAKKEFSLLLSLTTGDLLTIISYYFLFSLSSAVDPTKESMAVTWGSSIIWGGDGRISQSSTLWRRWKFLACGLFTDIFLSTLRQQYVGRKKSYRFVQNFKRIHVSYLNAR